VQADQPLPRRGFLLLAVLMLGWGLNWPFMKISLLEIPLWQYRGISLLVAGVMMLALAYLGGHPLAIARRHWPALAGAAVFNITVWHVFVAYGVIEIPSGQASVIGFTMPVWAVALGAIVLNERLTRRRGAALVLGIGGIAILLSQDFAALGASPLGVGYALVGSLGWAIGTIIVKRVAWGVPILTLAAWQLVIGGLPVAAIAIATEPPAVHQASLAALAAMAYTICIAIVLCYYAWFELVRIFPASVASIGTLSVPAVAMASGAIVLSEPLGWREGTALILVCGALALVLIQPRPAAE